MKNIIEVEKKDCQWKAKIWDNGIVKTKGFVQLGLNALCKKRIVKSELQKLNPTHKIIFI